MEPGLSVLDEASDLNFDIARGDEEEEALAEVRKKAEELQEAVENGFDDLLGLSDDEDEDLSTDQYFKPPHVGYGITTSTPNVQQAQMGYGITTSTPNTQAQNYARPHFTTPGYIMSPHAHGNGVALHEPAARDFANGMGTPFQASDEYGQDAVDSYCGGGDVGNKAPAVPFNLPAVQQLPQEPAPHQSDDYIQLQVMYKARLREVEKLSSELESLKQSSRVEISSLNAQLASLQAQEKLLADNFNQARQALAEKASETTSLSVKVVTLESQLEIETKLNQENLQKIRVAESTIRMLQEQISELSSSDGIVLMKRDYEKLLQTLKQKHHTELYDLNQQIAELNQQLSAKMAEVQACKERTSEREKWFEAQLLEKASVINQLTESLNKSQKQCQLFLENGAPKDTDHLLSQFRVLQQERMIECQKFTLLERELDCLFKVLLPKTTWSAYNSEFPKSNGDLAQEDDHGNVAAKIKSCCQEVSRLRLEVNRAQEALSAAHQELDTLRRKSQMSENEVALLQDKLQVRDGSETESQFQELRDELQRQVRLLEEKLLRTETAYQEIKQRERILTLEKDAILKSCGEEKMQAVEVCKNSILEMHHGAMRRLREELLSLSEQEKAQVKRDCEMKIQDLSTSYSTLQQTINDIKELYVRSCEEKRTLEARITELLSERETLARETEERLQAEFKEVLRKVHRRWEDEMMKQFQEQFQQEMTAVKDEYDAEKQREVADKEKDLRKEFQQEIVKAIQQERDKLNAEHASLLKRLQENMMASNKENEKHSLHHLRQVVEKLKADLHSKETELNQQVATFTEKESKLKVKLLKYQKSLEKVEKHHKDELLALERRHADKLASLQDQLRQLSLKSSKSSDENSQANLAKVMDKWSDWFTKCLDRIDKDVCTYMEDAERARKAEVRQLLQGYHEFLAARTGEPREERGRAPGTPPPRRSRPPLMTTPPEKLFPGRTDPHPERHRAHHSENPSARPGPSNPAFVTGANAGGCFPRHVRSENLDFKLTELDLSAQSDGSVFFSPPPREAK